MSYKSRRLPSRCSYYDNYQSNVHLKKQSDPPYNSDETQSNRVDTFLDSPTVPSLMFEVESTILKRENNITSKYRETYFTKRTRNEFKKFR